MNPFPLSSSDADQLIGEIGASTLYSFPPWGGIVQWRGRYVLIFQKVDNSFAFSDITGGVPYGSTMIPASALVASTPKTYVSPMITFWSSLPENFMQVAKEKLGGVIDAVTPSLPTTAVLFGVGLVVLLLFYGPKRRA